MEYYVISFVIFSSNFAQMIVLSVIGYLNDLNPKIPLTVAMPFGVQMFIFASLNFMGDEPRSFNKWKPDCELLKKHSRVVILALIQVLCVIGLMVMTLWKDYKTVLGEYFRLIYVIFFSIAIIAAAFWSLPRTVAKCNAYLYLCKIMQLSAGSAMTFFYTAPRSKGAVPCEGNPNFDYVFYQTYSGILDKIVTLGGVMLFQRYIRHWDARKAFWLTTAFTCVATICDIAIVERLDKKLGLSDEVSYLFGSTCIEGLTETLDELPATLLISKLCPKDVETTVFAILMANTNLGGTISSYVATDVQKWLGVEYAAKTCSNPYKSFLGLEFTALSWILIIGDIILPLLTIPLTWVLIPAVKLDSDFSALDGEAASLVEMSQMEAAQTTDSSARAGPFTTAAAAGEVNMGSLESLHTDQSSAEIHVKTAAFMRSNTRQLDSEMQ